MNALFRIKDDLQNGKISEEDAIDELEALSVSAIMDTEDFIKARPYKGRSIL